MTQTIETAIAEHLRRSPVVLFEAARRLHRSPSWGQQQVYSEAEVQQMCDGFSALLLEALEKRGAHVRTMVLETMIPGLLSRGETPGSVIHWNAAFMAMLSCEIVRALPEAQRSEATDWLSSFAGAYVADVAAATRAQGA